MLSNCLICGDKIGFVRKLLGGAARPFVDMDEYWVCSEDCFLTIHEHLDQGWDIHHDLKTIHKEL